MTYALFERIRGLLTNPVETFRNSKDDPGKTVVVYFGILLLSLAILSSLMTALLFTALSVWGFFSTTDLFAPKFMAMMPVVVFLEILVCGFVLYGLFGLWVHFWVWILGGRNGVGQTLKAFLYGLTPALVFGWIPLIGVLFAVWSFILDIIGLHELAGISQARAATAMLVAVIIPLVVAAVLFAVFVLPLMQTAMMSRQAGY